MVTAGSVEYGYICMYVCDGMSVVELFAFACLFAKHSRSITHSIIYTNVNCLLKNNGVIMCAIACTLCMYGCVCVFEICKCLFANKKLPTYLIIISG